MLLCNESFAATNEREGSQIARQVVDALIEAGVKVVFVTHLFDLADGFTARARHGAVPPRRAGDRRRAPVQALRGRAAARPATARTPTARSSARRAARRSAGGAAMGSGGDRSVVARRQRPKSTNELVAAFDELCALDGGPVGHPAPAPGRGASRSRRGSVQPGGARRVQAGKSTLINALLGAAGAAHRGGAADLGRDLDRERRQDRLVVCFHDGREQELPVARLAEYVTEARNPHNTRGWSWRGSSSITSCWRPGSSSSTRRGSGRSTVTTGRSPGPFCRGSTPPCACWTRASHCLRPSASC